MVRKLSLLIAVGILITGAGAFIGTMHNDNYSDGYMTAKTVAEAPSGVRPVTISDSNTSDSKLLTATVRKAVENGSARGAIPSQKQYDTVMAALPDSASNQAGLGSYVQYHGTIVRVEIARLV